MNDQVFGVDTYFELYTTLFGWYQYNHLWEILTSTGLVFLPFLGMLMRNFLDPVQSQLEMSASFTSLKRMQFDMIFMFTVIVLAAQPIFPIEVKELKFVKLCVAKGDGTFSQRTQTLESDTSQFAYTSYTKGGEGAKVPIWWYGVMAISSGITYSLKHSLPCLSDVRMVTVAFDSARIVEPELRQEVSQFVKDCFYPSYSFLKLTKEQRGAYAKWTSKHEDELIQIRGKHGHQSLGAGDIFSDELFINSPYLYQGRRSNVQVPAFLEIKDNKYPRCTDWWGSKKHQTEHYELSLFKRLSDHLNEYATDLIQTLKHHKISEDLIYQEAIQYVLDTNIASGVKQPLYRSQNDYMRGGTGSDSYFGDAWDTGIGFLGSLWDLVVKQYPLVYVTQQIASVVQAILLMTVYIVLPLAIVFSGYSYQFLIVGALGIFTIKFFSYLFHVAWWIDRNLYVAVKGEPSESMLGQLWNYFADTPEVIKINLITISMYFFLPVMATTLFAWAGYTILGGVEKLYNKLGGAMSAAGATAGGGTAMAEMGAGQVGRTAAHVMRRKGGGRSPSTTRGG